LKQITHNSLVYYQFDFWPKLTHGIFTRKGGVSPAPWDALNTGSTVGDDLQNIQHNQRLIYDALNVNSERICTVWQVHGNDTIIVTDPSPDRSWLAKADGMVTDKLDTPLIMRCADCTPVLFQDPIRKVVGLAHAGWRGIVIGAATSVAETMIHTYGCKPTDIQAGIGVSICPDCYQVGEEVVEAVQAYFGTLTGGLPDGPLVKRDPADGTAYFNLWSANKLDLQRTGLEQIEVAGICTACNTDEFYSHRAEKGKTGRFAAVISL
jgi:polyphenol oxidase